MIGRTRKRARAFLLTLLCSGLRISDVIRLARRNVDFHTGKRLLPWTQKTGQGVDVRLGAHCLDAFNVLPHESADCFFWNGVGKLSTAIGNARKSFDRICERAGIEGGYRHRCRDIFSIRLLDQGADIRDVQKLLGHRSIQVAEKQYGPWMRSSQDG